VRHQGIDERVAAAALEIAGAPPGPPKVQRVVGEAEVPLEVRAGSRAGDLGTVLEDEHLLGAQERRWPNLGAGVPGVLGCGEVRVGSSRSGGREAQHARPQGREHAQGCGAGRLVRCAAGAGVECVEEGDHRVEWVLVAPARVLDEGGVADPEPEHEAARVLGLEPGGLLGERCGLPGPDAGDAGGHHEMAGRREQCVDTCEGRRVRVAAADPQRAVAKALDERGEPLGVLVDRRASDPHADPADVLAPMWSHLCASGLHRAAPLCSGVSPILALAARRGPA
jgi:hypothetical protein